MKSLRNKKGQGTTEYVVILGLIVAIAVAVIWNGMGNSLNTKMTKITSVLNT